MRRSPISRHDSAASRRCLPRPPSNCNVTRLHTFILTGALLFACKAPDRDGSPFQSTNTDITADTPVDMEAINKQLEREYRQRVEATGKYQDCMKKSEGHEKEQAALIAKACGRMPDAPR